VSTWLITHSDCEHHDTGSGHPERIERLEAINQALADPAFADLNPPAGGIRHP